MKEALLAVDAILSCADDHLDTLHPDIVEARAAIDAARERLLDLVGELHRAERN